MIKRLSLAILAASAALTLAGCATSAPPALSYPPNPMVGGAAMSPDRTIVSNAMRSLDHTTFHAALRSTGLAEILAGAGPFTVFAPDNSAFAELPVLDALLQPENKTALTRVLTYHVVLGRISSDELARMIRAGGGRAWLKTASAGELLATLKDGKIMLTDESGASATVAIADVRSSNGILHVVDKVLIQRGFPGTLYRGRSEQSMALDPSWPADLNGSAPARREPRMPRH